jgi:ribosomal protein S18 acetylase RimI-like enzyme
MTRRPPAIHVRPAEATDEAALLALDAAAWTPQSGFPSVLAAAGRPGASFFSEENPPGIHLVAEADGALAGRVLGYIRLKPPSPLPENAHVMYVAGIAVDPAARGRGIATALIEAAERHAADHGARKLSLRVLSSNSAAIRLYERLGFGSEGTLAEEFLIDGRYVDDVLMAKRL